MSCFCRSSKTISIRIILLDETDFLHEIQQELLGQSLLEVVFTRLNLLETSYFGLRFVDVEGQAHWLEPNTRLSRQLKENKDIYEFYFSVKFYAVDPCKLVEEITRYQFYLQLKQDVLQGRLPVTFELASQLGAYIIQSEIGDYDPSKHSYGYVSEFRIVPNQTKELESRIVDIHKQIKGIGPAQAEFNFLDKVKWLDMYGVDLHPVLGEDSVEYFLGLTPSGIIVLRNKSSVAHYYWPRIVKVYFKGRYFMIRVCDKNNEVSTYGFETPKKTACKHLWKCCVEHHAFFRLVRMSNEHPQATVTDIFSLGSRFRYSGRTQREASKEATSIKRIPPAFVRRPSRRQIRRNFDAPSSDLYMTKSFETSENMNVGNNGNNSGGKFETKSISVPQPAYTLDSLYRSTNSIPATFDNNNTIQKYNSHHRHSTPDSPRSTRSAGWAKSQQRGLFGITSSPKSVRSASSRNGTNSVGHRQRSSSVESQSSNDSRSGRRHRSRSKRMSDNESELSRGSGRSGRSHRKHRRHRSRNRSEYGSEYNHNNEPVALIDSGKQWLEVQRKQAEMSGLGNSSGVQQASVKNSSAVTTTTDTYNRNKKNRKHRSPSDGRGKVWSSELTKHLQFDLVDTSGMTEDQLREIPYTVIETQSQKQQQLNRKRNTSSLKVHKTAHVKDRERVDRIRGLPNDGSIRSGSTNSSSQDFEKSNGLNRMMSSLSMGEFGSSTFGRVDYAAMRASHEHTDSGLGDQDYAYSSERSSDSAKYTNKSSGTSILSGKINSSSTPVTSSTTTSNNHSSKYYQSSKHHHRERDGINIITSAPVHKKMIANDNNNLIISRYINTNNNISNSTNRIINPTPSHNNIYSLSLNRHHNHKNHFASKHGVGGCISTLTSPYAGNGIEKVHGGSKSDIGIPLTRRIMLQQQIQQRINRKTTTNILPQTTATALPSVYSDLSLFDSSSDMRNGNVSHGNYNSSSLTGAITKTGSKLLYTNKHRKSSLTNSNYGHGPLLYHNTDESDNGNWENSLYDNPIRSNNDGLSGLSSIEKVNKKAVNSSRTNDRSSQSNNNLLQHKSSSLELILTPIIQSRRAAKQ